MVDPEAHRRVADFLLTDANERLRYSQEFSVSGFKTLILINGGAIIALVTYAGHSTGNGVASRLSYAFIAYAGGLCLTMIAYIAGYFSQGQFMQHSTLLAYKQLGLEPITDKSAEAYERYGSIAVWIAVALCVLSLVAFVLGSWLAMNALA